jgi:hypothetical protein
VAQIYGFFRHHPHKRLVLILNVATIGAVFHFPTPTPIEFVFSEEERTQAMEEGMRRQAVNEAKGLRGRNKGPRFGDKALEVHLLGAAGKLPWLVTLV